MFKILAERKRQKKRTIAFPKTEPQLPDRYQGKPEIEQTLCNNCSKCVSSCPVEAITLNKQNLCLDLAKCIFCLECLKACKTKAIKFTNNYQMSARTKKDLLVTNKESIPIIPLKNSLFKKSLKLRQISAGGCNACEADINVLTTIVYDLGRFGIQFVASPRHADGILVTGPVTRNMQTALKKTYEAIPSPKIVIAVGTCSISGGLFREQEEASPNLDEIVPVDLYIPGCPPHPMTILHGLLKFLGKQ